MDSVRKELTLLLLLVLFLLGLCINALEYKVGDESGWVNGNVDYNNWAALKPFHVDDILIFEYDPQNHNVLLVNRSSFLLCDTASPIATFVTGHDSFVIRGPGHYYFICGFVGHCQAGQKIDIRVPKVPPMPTSIPIKESSSAPLPSFMAPSPSISNAQSHFTLLSSANGLYLTLVWAFNLIVFLGLF